MCLTFGFLILKDVYQTKSGWPHWWTFWRRKVWMGRLRWRRVALCTQGRRLVAVAPNRAQRERQKLRLRRWPMMIRHLPLKLPHVCLRFYSVRWRCASDGRRVVFCSLIFGGFEMDICGSSVWILEIILALIHNWYNFPSKVNILFSFEFKGQIWHIKNIYQCLYI